MTQPHVHTDEPRFVLTIGLHDSGRAGAMVSLREDDGSRTRKFLWLKGWRYWLTWLLLNSIAKHGRRVTLKRERHHIETNRRYW